MYRWKEEEKVKNGDFLGSPLHCSNGKKAKERGCSLAHYCIIVILKTIYLVMVHLFVTFVVKL